MKNHKKLLFGLVLLTSLLGLGLKTDKVLAFDATDLSTADYVVDTDGSGNTIIRVSAGGETVIFADSNPGDSTKNYKPKNDFAGMAFCPSTASGSSNKGKGITFDGKNYLIDVDFDSRDGCPNANGSTVNNDGLRSQQSHLAGVDTLPCDNDRQQDY
jgi:hypothetical protein